MSAIDEYLKNVTPSQRNELERVRQIVKQIVPEAEEAISYGMPAFKYHQQYLIWFAAFKNHLSIFPTSGPIVAMGKKLAKFRTAKGTLQFTADNPISESTLKEMIVHRLNDISEK